jgi:nicotinamidase-related amidase
MRSRPPERPGGGQPPRLRRAGARGAAVTEQCILYSTLDAYVRHFQVVVPTDAVAHIDPDLGAAALKMMEQNMSAELTTAADCLG